MTGNKFDFPVCGHHSGLVKELKALRMLMDEREKQGREALKIAREDMERRLESMNEFRAQLEKQTKEFKGITECRLEMDPVRRDVKDIRRIIDTQSGARKWSDHIVTVIIGLIVLLCVWVLTK